MAQIDIADILSIAFKNLPSLYMQKAIVEEIEILKKQGYSEAQAVKRVFENNPIGNKAH